MGRLLDPAEVRRLVRTSDLEPEVVAATEAALEGRLEPLSAALVPKEYLQRIYERRLSRPGVVARVVGADTFLSRLEGYEGEGVTSVAIGVPGKGVAIWLDQDATRVIAVTIARDARHTPSGR
jgi:hypothetical protein